MGVEKLQSGPQQQKKVDKKTAASSGEIVDVLKLSETVQYAPQGWLNILGIENLLGIHERTINRVKEKYRKSNPERYKDYKNKQGRIFEHYHPDLVEVIKGEVKMYENAPIGRKTNKGVSTLLLVGKPIVARIANTYRETNPEWFQKYKTLKTSVFEHYHPELVNIITQSIGNQSLAPNGWMTAKSIASHIGNADKTITNISNHYRKDHGERFQLYKNSQGKLLEHYHPDLIETIKQTLNSQEFAPEGWQTITSLAKKKKVSAKYIENIIKNNIVITSTQIKNYKIPKLSRIALYYHPDIISKINTIIDANIDAPEGWQTNAAVAAKLERNQTLISNIAKEIGKSHPDYFKYFKSKNGQVLEHYHPELVNMITCSVFSRDDDVPEGWLTVGAGKKVIGADNTTIVKYAKQFRLTHPEWFKYFKSKSGEATREYYHPDLIKKLKEYVDSKKILIERSIQILNPSKYKDLAKTLGWSAMMEIFIAHHPQYQDIPFSKLQKIVADYLGKSAVLGGDGLFGGIERPDIGIILALPTLRETLVTAIKTDYLQALIDFRKKTGFQRSGFKDIYAQWKEKIIPKIQNLYPDIGELMEEVESQLYEVFDNRYHSDDLVDDLGDDGRKFPGFEQRYNIAEFVHKKRLLVADEMGLGKTATAICAKEHIKQEVKTAMVVCPANMISTWVERLGDEVAENGKPIGYFKKGKAPKILIIDSKKDLEKNFADYDYVIMSSARLTDDNVSKALEQDYQMLIVDEVHEVKNLTSGVWSKNLVKLSDKLNGSGYVMTLSGTPVPNTVKDIAIHMRILYPHEFDGIENRDIVASMMNQDKLNVGLKLRNRMSRKRLLDWIPMTQRRDEVHFTEPNEFEQSIIHMIVEDEEQSAMQKIQKLRKLAMCPQALNPEWEGKLSAKMVELGDFLVSELQKKDKVMVVFNDFIEDIIRSDAEVQLSEEELVQSEGLVIDYITKRLQQAGIGQNIETFSYHGNTEQKRRQEIQSKINNESGKKLLFLSGNAARVGIDLSGIESVGVYNHPWTKSDLEQQISRVYRVGVKHDVDVHHFITAGTIEEGIWNFMHEKERVVRKLVDGTEILTEEEKELLMSEDMTDMKGYHPDQEFAQYYYTQKEFLYEQFQANKGVGEERFSSNMDKMTRGSVTRGEKYAEVYKMLGRRNYQFNANRVNNALIQYIIRSEGEELDIETVRVLDMASASQILSQTASPELKARITSNDINLSHFPSGENIDAMLKQDAYTKFDSKEGEYMYGSMSKTLYDEESFDIINCSLAWHYTGLDDKQEKYDRIHSLVEANRILKPGGYMIINEIYSLSFAERNSLEQALHLLGFAIVDRLTGVITSQHDNTFKSNILTVVKTGAALSSEELLSKSHKKVLLQGLKFSTGNYNGIHNQTKILEEFLLNDKSYKIPLNKDDQELKAEEEKALEQIKSLKSLFKDENSKEDPILNVPESTLHSNSMFSFFDKSSDGKKIRRVAKKLTDGSFIFVN